LFARQTATLIVHKAYNFPLTDFPYLPIDGIDINAQELQWEDCTFVTHKSAWKQVYRTGMILANHT